MSKNNRKSPVVVVGITARQLIQILFTATAIVPGYLMITASLKTQEEFLSHPWSLPLHPSFAGYKAAWNDQFPRWFTNSLIVTTSSVVLTVAIAAMAAWGFAHWVWRGRETVLGILVSLMVVPPVVLLIPLFRFGATLGWISTFRILIMIYVGLMLPFSVYLLTNFFRAIPASIIEAAEIDGASDLRTFRSIVLPLSGPPLITLTVVNLLWAWNELLLALVFLQSDEKKTLMVGITGFQNRYSLSIPTIMAGMTIATVPPLIAYLFGQRYFVAGLTSGSVKGE
ncbi:MAG TPA: carbohydrate ABC transporter permease [Candidatus Paceibacterota bacterium]|nr:carbohydrate ABC transporter permease [Candidatus Paceibacterota bacterium]